MDAVLTILRFLFSVLMVQHLAQGGIVKKTPLALTFILKSQSRSVRMPDVVHRGDASIVY